jgi:predicted dehydrogenase
VLDMVSYLLGDVSEVCGASQTFVHERPLTNDPKKKGKVTVDDLTVATLKLKSGALAVVDSSWMAAGRKDYFYFEVNGSEGSIRFNFERLDELQVYLKDDSGVGGFREVIVTSKKHPSMEKFWVDQGGGFAWNHLFVLEEKMLLDSVAQGRQVTGPSLRDGYINQLLIDSIVESNRTGDWVSIRPKA